MDKITFTASVYKVQTLVDGGIRITLDLAGTDETMIAMTQLGACQIHGVGLRMVAQPIESENVYRTPSRRKAKERNEPSGPGV